MAAFIKELVARARTDDDSATVVVVRLATASNTRPSRCHFGCRLGSNSLIILPLGSGLLTQSTEHAKLCWFTAIGWREREYCSREGWRSQAEAAAPNIYKSRKCISGVPELVA